MKEGLQPGLQAEITVITTPQHGVTHLGEDAPNVLSTPSMIGLMERTAIQSIAPQLEEQEGSVGVRVNISHMAATTIGQKVTVRATLDRVEGRRLFFSVAAFNEKEKIGEGTHERVVILKKRFARPAAQP